MGTHTVSAETVIKIKAVGAFVNHGQDVPERRGGFKAVYLATDMTTQTPSFIPDGQTSCSSSPTSTPTITPTDSTPMPTPTFTATLTDTSTPTYTATPTDMATPTKTPTATPNPSQAVSNLTGTINTYVANGSITGGVGASLTSKLQNTQLNLAQGRTNAALKELQAFMNAVQAQRGKKITTAAADALIAQAQAIIAQIQAAPTPTPASTP